ncbi:DMT family transporter [Aneurinibacillus terranovensis]|uniref:DMT family transporter n=1 Tax=Aneurinibacillus terranovensis TaxID=278991 RepID=UPI0004073D20|nr:DMT family transporter [Aneurinibacillus terranovensis]
MKGRKTASLSCVKKKQETGGILYGFLGVLGFSLTLPATRFSVDYFGPTMIGLGRAVVAAVLAGIVLFARKEKLPTYTQIKGLVLVAIGVIIGFPLLSAWAMGRLPAVHGAVVLALLPLATAGAAVLRAGERPSRGFWLASIAGCLSVLGYAVYSGLGSLHTEDFALLGAVVAAAFGYAEGGKLSRVLGGWQVIAWALVVAAPFLVIPVIVTFPMKALTAPPQVWGSFAYLSIGSQFLAFIAWYNGLAVGGVARVSQLQYLQPFLTIVWSAILLGERITITTVGTALIIVISVVLGRKASVASTSPQGSSASPQEKDIPPHPTSS